MKYRWDAQKSRKTLKERGYSFDIMQQFDWSFATCLDIQFFETEERELWIGPIGDRLYCVVMSERDDHIRIISLRRAVQNEINEWRKEFQNV